MWNIPEQDDAGYDLILSSGFLAFARHAGVLAALETQKISINAVVGTSSSSLVGALWCAGLPVARISEALARHRPITLMRPNPTPWRGVFRLDAMIRYLETLLPRSFDDLARPLAVGVIDEEGRYQLLREGLLAHAVAASCAMPYIFQPIVLNEQPYQDGGTADRLGIDAWRALRPNARAIAHQVARTAGNDVTTDLRDITMINTPRSGANFLSLGDFQGQLREAETLAEAALRQS